MFRDDPDAALPEVKVKVRDDRHALNGRLDTAQGSIPGTVTTPYIANGSGMELLCDSAQFNCQVTVMTNDARRGGDSVKISIILCFIFHVILLYKSKIIPTQIFLTIDKIKSLSLESA